MTQITSMTGPVSSLRAQLRAQAEAALGTETNKTPFTDRLGDAIREVAVAQNSAANLTKSRSSRANVTKPCTLEPSKRDFDGVARRLQNG